MWRIIYFGHPYVVYSSESNVSLLPCSTAAAKLLKMEETKNMEEGSRFLVEMVC